MDQICLKRNGYQPQGSMQVALCISFMVLTHLMNRNIGLEEVMFSNGAGSITVRKSKTQTNTEKYTKALSV